MFDYLIKKKHFVIQLGQYVSHQIIGYWDADNSVRIYRTEKELNELDRLELAYNFYENYVHLQYLEGSIPKEDIVEDIARFIDKRIPQSYLKWHLKLDVAPSQVNADEYSHGLMYHYKENQ